ncbi:MAG: riboflavin biosynthesis protein RibF [Clostridia bacterium]|nr:riboflavin biosynthesis protein RibF [Clostridia bacterium]
MLDKKTVIALGYFDSLHIGHRAVISGAIKHAKKTQATTTVFTFDGNVKNLTRGQELPDVYTLEERRKMLYDMGVNELFVAPVNKEYLSLSPTEFLTQLNQKLNVSAYFCGEDYRFGYKGSGDVTFLQEYAKTHGQKVFVQKIELIDGEKVSTTGVKQFLQQGKIEKANECLVTPYSITGVVNGDRKVGRSLGFPTANLGVDYKQSLLKQGVYAGVVKFDDKKFPAVINYGERPTYGLTNSLLEAHLIGFKGDLYGKQITVEFLSFIRETQKFPDGDTLKQQIAKDVELVKGITL